MKKFIKTFISILLFIFIISCKEKAMEETVEKNISRNGHLKFLDGK
jgi:hypothetical protein